ncbi:TrmH family RNA methyltransferase [Metamycoplasma sualvi]|uniref:TrmH family RNA methyltransferase n=1 Tax=Metamycoplasma sualvi TaxID=2125 RepID=UPI003872F8B5
MKNNLLSKNQILHIKKLMQKKYRYQYQEFIIEGLHLIEEALKHPKIIKYIVTSDVNFKHKSVPVLITSYENICKLSTTKSPQPYIGICNFIQNNHLYEKDFILLLDNINDPGNLGTIIRTAHAFGVKDIILKGVDIYNPKIVRSTQGAIFNINIVNNVNLIETVTKLKNDGFKIIGSLLKDSIDYNKVEIKDKKLVLILGNESHGINQDLINLLDYKVYIPIKFESLNVAIACGILLSKYLK